VGYPNIDPKSSRTIVGVVGDVRYRSIAEEAEPSFYVPQGQFPFPRQTVIIATRSADPAAIAASVRSEILRLEPQMVFDVDTASNLVAATLTRQQLGMTLMLVFGVTALVLAAVGIYGVIAYASAQRLGEIATRLALGATPGQVFWLLMRRGQWLALTGVGLAWPRRTAAAAPPRASSTACAPPIRSCSPSRPRSSSRSRRWPPRFPRGGHRARIRSWRCAATSGRLRINHGRRARPGWPR